MIRVLIADDNAVIREGVRSLLATIAEDIEVVGEAADGREAVEQAEAREPDVVLLDIRMPVMNGVEAARRLSPRFRVMMLTYSDEEELVTGAIRAGASGYLVHGRFEPSELERAVREVQAGRPVLSPSVTPTVLEAIRSAADDEGEVEMVPFDLTAREADVMSLIANGRSNREIAEELVVSEKTVKNHTAAIYSKLSVSSRSQAAAKWLGVVGE